MDAEPLRLENVCLRLSGLKQRFGHSPCTGHDPCHAPLPELGVDVSLFPSALLQTTPKIVKYWARSRPRQQLLPDQHRRPHRPQPRPTAAARTCRNATCSRVTPHLRGQPKGCAQGAPRAPADIAAAMVTVGQGSRLPRRWPLARDSSGSASKQVLILAAGGRGRLRSGWLGHCTERPGRCARVCGQSYRG